MPPRSFLLRIGQVPGSPVEMSAAAIRRFGLRVLRRSRGSRRAVGLSFFPSDPPMCPRAARHVPRPGAVGGPVAWASAPPRSFRRLSCKVRFVVVAVKSHFAVQFHARGHCKDDASLRKVEPSLTRHLSPRPSRSCRDFTSIATILPVRPAAMELESAPFRRTGSRFPTHCTQSNGEFFTR